MSHPGYHKSTAERSNGNAAAADDLYHGQENEKQRRIFGQISVSADGLKQRLG